MTKIIFFLVLLNAFSCSGLGQKVSKRVTKASRFPASKKTGFRPSYIGSELGTVKLPLLEKYMGVDGPSWTEDVILPYVVMMIKSIIIKRKVAIKKVMLRENLAITKRIFFKDMLIKFVEMQN